MANFAYIENGEVVGVYDQLPENWKNISNFYTLSTEESYLSTLGWYKIRQEVPEYGAGQRLGKLKYIFDGSSVKETFEVETIPEQPAVVRTEAQIAADQAAVMENQWSYVRHQRDTMMADTDWRYLRYDRELRLGLTPTDDIQKLDLYMQALADITQQSDPFNIVWPELNAS